MTETGYDFAWLAEMYEPLNPWGVSDEFFLSTVMSADRVLDAGCGTGAVLRRARAAGHGGRLCGFDPAEAMLRRARVRDDVEWHVSDTASIGWRSEFDLAIMSNHVFQELIEEAELTASLRAIRAALRTGGRFVFDTLNPATMAWRSWTPRNAVTVTTPDGDEVTISHDAGEPVDGVLSLATTFHRTGWEEPRTVEGRLRFVETGELAGLLSDAGLIITEQYGDFDRSPLTPTSPQIITVAVAE
ncbi:methyltransferase family protein [Stackebrandtia albiflava]|uniref:Methyltransferase family protein n=1 Tax=Stackebrandtia albiflava TaxID=406432 RepID=A0A562VB16_9ACTN|nr:class I SAM-dependent methyltransferase [Stackebrandtia albiflava]TWJ15053.1 methyltransferase family protein [Stackebrandtia albiflava]